jgi:hypothetical protein
MEFVHIPLAMSYDKTLAELSNKKKTGQKKKAVERLKMVNAVQRQQLSLRSMWEKSEAKAEKDKIDNPWGDRMSIAAVMMNYGHRLAKDHARIHIKEALVNPTGSKKPKPLLKPIKGNKKPSGWKKLESFKRYGILADHYMEPHAFEMWEALRTIDEKASVVDKVAAITKLWQFANSTFLGIYDVVQHFMSGTPFIGLATHPIKTGTNIVRAVHGALTHNVHMQEAMENNAFSKPYDYPFTQLLEQVKRMNKISGKHDIMKQFGHYVLGGFTQTSPMRKYNKQVIGPIKTGTINIPFLEKEIYNPLNLLLGLYRMSWDGAWKLDEMVRLYTYLQLKDQGLSKQDAGDLTARFHGDYASVPPNTRRMANRAFFTPTFKIAMGKLYGSMIKAWWTVPKDLFTPGKKVDPVEARFMIGLMGTAGVNLAFDTVMRSLGYEVDDEDAPWIFNFGRKYIKYDNDRFGPSTITFTWSNPANLPQRYLERIWRAWADKEASLPERLYNLVKWDLHPVINTGSSMAMNLTPEGDQIWSEFDPPREQVLQKAGFVISNMVKLTELGQNDLLELMPDSFMPELKSKGKVRAEKYRQENFNLLAKILTSKGIGLMNLRVRTPKEQRAATQLKLMIMRFKAERRRHSMLSGANRTMTLKQLKELKKRINSLTAEIQEAQEKKKPKKKDRF